MIRSTMRRVLLAGCVMKALIASSASAQTPGFSERDVSFRNGSVELQGTLMLPTNAGLHPAVVFLHGSGPSTRAGARDYAVAFSKLGIASLFFDKRGSGKSGGSWTTASLDDLAGDGLAAVSLLKSTPRIDTSRIGFWGVSQAGWVATRAAAQSPDIAFMILISGGGASPRESERFSYQQSLDHAGLSDADKSEAWSMIDDYFKYLSTGEGRPQLVKRLEAAHNAKWYSAAPLDRILPSDENRPNWSWVANWDPSADIRKLRMPVLLMFGDRDTDQPTEIAVQKWREGLKQAGNDSATIVIFPGAAHGIRMGGHKAQGRAPFADGYAEVMLGWLWLHVASAN